MTQSHKTKRETTQNKIKVTWEEARSHCEAEGMRLCNSQAELDKCCGKGCEYNNKLIWSSLKEGMSFIIVFYGKYVKSFKSLCPKLWA